MNRLGAFGLVLALNLGLPGLCDAGPLRARTPVPVMSQEEGAIEFQGRQRSYRLFAPAGAPKLRRLPLVVVLHGGGGSPASIEKVSLGRLNELAEQQGWLVVYPAALKLPGAGRHWNDGRDFQPQRKSVDDVGFLVALIDHLASTKNADPKHVFMTGMSNGAIMSFRFACEQPGRVAAIAPVAGALAENLARQCATGGAVPVLVINGESDPFMPWNGGYVHSGRKKMGRVISGPDTARLWATRDGCTGPRVRRWPDRVPSDGTTVRQESYECPDRQEVELYAIEGGGHAWPGGRGDVLSGFIGRTSQELNASDDMWEFFNFHASND